MSNEIRTALENLLDAMDQMGSCQYETLRSDARAALNRDQGGQGAEPVADELRSALSDVVSVAITMLYDSHKPDVVDEFTVDELKDVVERTKHLQDARVEDVYRAGYMLLTTPTPATTPRADEWIRCEDRLPEFTGWYLVTLADPDDIGWSTSVSWAAFWNGDAFEECDPVEDGQPVTHWMPFPQPPAGQEGT